MAQTLAPIYLDNDRVRLQGDPRPTVSKILSAGGKKADEFRVVRLRDKNEEAGETLGPQDVIDRTSAEEDVYLKLVTQAGPKGTAKGAGSSAGATEANSSGKAFGGGQEKGAQEHEWSAGTPRSGGQDVKDLQRSPGTGGPLAEGTETDKPGATGTDKPAMGERQTAGQGTKSAGQGERAGGQGEKAGGHGETGKDADREGRDNPANKGKVAKGDEDIRTQ